MLQIIHPWMPVAVFRIRTSVTILMQNLLPCTGQTHTEAMRAFRFPTGKRLGVRPPWSAPGERWKCSKKPRVSWADCSQPLTPSQPSLAAGLLGVATHWNKPVPCWPQEAKQLSWRCTSVLPASRPSAVVSLCAPEAVPLHPLCLHITRVVRELHCWDGEFGRKKGLCSC